MVGIWVVIIGGKRLELDKRNAFVTLKVIFHWGRCLEENVNV